MMNTETVMINGLVCKIGKFGHVYYLDGGEWTRSNKLPDEFYQEKQKQEKEKQKAKLKPC